MRLQDWMKRERHTDGSFIEKVNEALKQSNHKALSWRAVAPWRTGVAVPRPPVVDAISAVTGGEVAYEDHVAEQRKASAA